MNSLVSLSTVVVLIGLSQGRTGFKKDKSLTKYKFPPKLIQPHPGSFVPMGHLRPLGHQRASSGAVPRVAMPDPETFYREHVYHHKPVMFHDAVHDTPAIEKWSTDKFLKEEFGDLNIHVVVKKEAASAKSVPKKMLLRKFLREYEYEDWYLTTSTPQPMMPDLTLPRCVRCGLVRYLLESVLWMSSGGTASLLHAHADHQIHCLLAGRKDFIFVHDKYREKVAFVEQGPYSGAGYSEVDPDMVNLYQHTELPTVAWTHATLHPGDCVYVPARYMHQVRSYGRSISWTTSWSPQPHADFSDCLHTDLNQTVTLSDVTLVWTYVDADRRLSDVTLDAASLRHILLLLIKDESALSYEAFSAMFDEIMSELDVKESVENVWNILDTENSKNITREQILSLDEDVLKQVAQKLNVPHIQLPHDEL